ncbi:MAG: Gfo/Idh/MocA family oxidoreductase [Nitrososphaerota archaeon]|nr:Gfo/Idh/MocA family oxidoreductase [Nitrososphaerota archaeon]MDG6947247.1 Gfo/Idh/MocA family oxidoreductase [Nitrososphaerota archaeon]MDG6955320.1 Gfo/Idh/MocA family oxidoreductase [Nitrososphaerota archaeon]
MVRKLKVAAIGCGSWIQAVHLPAISQNESASLIACADTDSSRGRAVQQKFGIPKFYESYEEMLGKESPDLVLVAIPHALHAPATKQALESGANVVVEKPMATTLEDAIGLAQLARSKGKFVVVGHEMRLQRNVQAAKRMVVEGKLGRPYFARALYLRRRGVPATATFLVKELAHGGSVFDIGSHSVDAALFMLGFPKPVSVTGRTHSIFSTRKEVRYGYRTRPDFYPGPVEVEDVGFGIVEFEGGLSAYLETCWAGYIMEDTQQIAIEGDQGGVHVEGNSLHVIGAEEDYNTLTELAFSGQPGSVQYKEFYGLVLDAVQKGETEAPFPLCTVDQGVYGVAVMTALYASAEEHGQHRIGLPTWLRPQHQPEPPAATPP